jgi:hypothetical protein
LKGRAASSDLNEILQISNSNTDILSRSACILLLLKNPLDDLKG